MFGNLPVGPALGHQPQHFQLALTQFAGWCAGVLDDAFTYTVEDEAGQSATYRLVGPDETDASSGRISIESPMARALLGKRVGDDAVVRRPRGESELVITAIRYEAEG